MALSLIPVIIFAFGLLLFFGGLGRLRRKPLRATLRASSGATLMACAALSWVVALNFHTYQRLTAEQAVAQLRFTRMAPQMYEVTFTQPDGRKAQFVLHGDEWQLDARILKWKGLAVLAGMDTRYRLERLSGRYRDVKEELSRERSVINLAPSPWLERWDLQSWSVDLWDVAEDHPRWMPMVDAVYGSATYLPMADGAEYQVSVTSSGLIARPVQVIL